MNQDTTLNDERGEQSFEQLVRLLSSRKHWFYAPIIVVALYTLSLLFGKCLEVPFWEISEKDAEKIIQLDGAPAFLGSIAGMVLAVLGFMITTRSEGSRVLLDLMMERLMFYLLVGLSFSVIAVLLFLNLINLSPDQTVWMASTTIWLSISIVFLVGYVVVNIGKSRDLLFHFKIIYDNIKGLVSSWNNLKSTNNQNKLQLIIESWSDLERIYLMAHHDRYDLSSFSYKMVDILNRMPSDPCICDFIEKIKFDFVFLKYQNQHSFNRIDISNDMNFIFNLIRLSVKRDSEIKSLYILNLPLRLIQSIYRFDNIDLGEIIVGIKDGFDSLLSEYIDIKPDNIYESFELCISWLAKNDNNDKNICILFYFYRTIEFYMSDSKYKTNENHYLRFIRFIDLIISNYHTLYSDRQKIHTLLCRCLIIVYINKYRFYSLLENSGDCVKTLNFNFRPEMPFLFCHQHSLIIFFCLINDKASYLFDFDKVKSGNIMHIYMDISNIKNLLEEDDGKLMSPLANALNTDNVTLLKRIGEVHSRLKRFYNGNNPNGVIHP